MKRSAKIVAGALLSIALVAGVLFFSYPKYLDEESAWPNTAFDPESWKRTPDEGRYVMVKDLIAKETLNGLTKEEVIELLGEPDPSGNDLGRISYLVKVGSETIGFSKVFVLDVALDQPDGKVVSYGIRGD